MVVDDGQCISEKQRSHRVGNYLILVDFRGSEDTSDRGFSSNYLAFLPHEIATEDMQP